MRKYNREDRSVICDVCGFPYTVKDVIKVTDKYSRQFGLVVCKYDLDKSNPQDRPFQVRETIVTAIDKIRPDSDRFADNQIDDRLPGAPTNGICRVDSINDYINLYWDAPNDQGSSNITGYVVQRGAPEGVFFSTISSNTGTSAAFYQDTSATVSEQYSFRVAAINGYGTGPYSEPFFWPGPQSGFNDGLNYLQISQSSLLLTTGAGAYIIL